MAGLYDAQARDLVARLDGQLQHLEAGQSRLMAGYQRDLNRLLDRIAALDERAEILLLLLRQINAAQQGGLFSSPLAGASSGGASGASTPYPRSQDQWVDRLTRLTRLGEDFQ
jgi:hypothetical protein